MARLPFGECAAGSCFGAGNGIRGGGGGGGRGFRAALKGWVPWAWAGIREQGGGG